MKVSKYIISEAIYSLAYKSLRFSCNEYFAICYEQEKALYDVVKSMSQYYFYANYLCWILPIQSIKQDCMGLNRYLHEKKDHDGVHVKYLKFSIL